MNLDVIHVDGNAVAMITVSSTDCRRRFYELARAAEAGEVILVTRYGRPAFKLKQHEATVGEVERFPEPRANARGRRS